MDIVKYFSKLNGNSQKVFQETMDNKEVLGSLHNLSSHIFEFAEIINDDEERRMLETVSAQLESSTYSLTLGLYRQAFSSLRLALEMGLASIYFSAYKLEMQEWISARNDIIWSKLVDEDNGVLSKRFVSAFFDSCIDSVDIYNLEARKVYRILSEYVHGNNETWNKNGVEIKFDIELLELYASSYEAVVKTILFTAICRYQNSFNNEIIEKLYFLPEIFNQNDEIRAIFGQPTNKGI